MSLYTVNDPGPIQRILLIQTRRLGDVLCATPVCTALRHQFPYAHLAIMVRAGLREILDGNPDVNEVLTYDRDAVNRSPFKLLGLIRDLRGCRFDWALSIHASDALAYAVCRAGIPRRTWVWWDGGWPAETRQT